MLRVLTGKSGSGRVRAPLKKEAKQNVSKKLRVANLSSGQTNGLNSSLVFTPVQVGLGCSVVEFCGGALRFGVRLGCFFRLSLAWLGDGWVGVSWQLHGGWVLVTVEFELVGLP